jgi:hypothetical protein
VKAAFVRTGAGRRFLGMVGLPGIGDTTKTPTAIGARDGLRHDCPISISAR